MNNFNRRDFLTHPMGACGSLALSWLLSQEGFAASIEANNLNPLAPRLSHFPSKAKSVIFMFMVGGPSQIDLFDPKP